MEGLRGAIFELRLKETLGKAFPPKVLLPDLTPDLLERHASWLTPNHSDPEAGRGAGKSTVASGVAATVASPPSGSFAFGYRWPILFSASSRIHLP